DVVKQLGAKGPVAMVGYVFDGGWAQRNRTLLDHFLIATQQAKKILADSPAEWQRLALRIGGRSVDARGIYRRLYLEGVPPPPLAEEGADARALYGVLAEIGGADLVGPAPGLDPGTFYSARPNE